MPKSTPLHVIVRKVQQDSLSPDEIKEFFRIDPSADRPFDPNPRLNTDAVDISGLEGAAQAIESAIVLDLARHGQPPAKNAVDAGKEVPDGLLAEGDSWFRLPDVIMPKTVIDFLRPQHNVRNLARWGDALDDIIREGQFWPYIYSRKVKTFFLSAGGNDVLGSGKLYEMLNVFDDDHAKPEHAEYYLNDNFRSNLDRVMRKIEGLVADIVGEAPDIRIVMHGYDYAIPQVTGHWLGVPMERQGLDPVHRSPLCKAIIRAMIDHFNNRLASVERKFERNFVHLDLRGKIKANEWFDELHMRAGAAQRLSRLFARQIGQHSLDAAA